MSHPSLRERNDGLSNGFGLHNLVTVHLQTANDVAEGRLSTESFHLGHLCSEGEAHLVASDEAEVLPRRNVQVVRHVDREAVDHAEATVPEDRGGVAGERRILAVPTS
jgi:hypothetical protein